MHRLTEEYLHSLRAEMTRCKLGEDLIARNLAETCLHLEESRVSLEELDLTEAEAAQAAIDRFGAPKRLARALAKERKRMQYPPIDLPTVFAIAGSTAIALSLMGNPLSVISQSTINLGICLGCLVGVVSLGAKRLQFAAVASASLLAFGIMAAVFTTTWVSAVPTGQFYFAPRAMLASRVAESKQMCLALDLEIQRLTAYKTGSLTRTSATDEAFRRAAPSLAVSREVAPNNPSIVVYRTSLKNRLKAERSWQLYNQGPLNKPQVENIPPLLYDAACLAASWFLLLLGIHSTAFMVGSLIRLGSRSVPGRPGQRA